MINVLDLPGINADGITDDTAVIARAIRDARTGERIHFPVGEYLIRTVWISGKQQLKISGEGTLIPANPANPILRINTKAGVPTNGLIIEGLLIRGTVAFNGAHHSTVRDCRFLEQPGHPGIRAFNTHDLILRANHIYGRSIGIECYSPDSRYTGNILTDCDIAIQSNSANVMIDNNRMFPYPGSMQTGIYLGGLAKWMHLIGIHYNNIGHPDGFGIHARFPLDANDCWITGNQFLQADGKALVYNVEMDESQQQIRRMDRPY